MTAPVNLANLVAAVPAEDLDHSPEALGVTLDPAARDLWPRRGPVLAASESGARRALAEADLRPEDVRGFVWISTAGVKTMEQAPQWLHWRLGMSREVRLWFTGGNGARDALGALINCGTETPSPVGEGPTLLVAAELAASVPSDPILSNYAGMGTADGATAAVLGGKRPDAEAPVLAGWHRDLFVREIGEEEPGARGLVARQLGPSVADGCRRLGWRPEDLHHFLIHPGNTDAVEAAEYSLAEAVGREVALPDAREVFGRDGDAGGASIFAQVANLLRRERADGRPGVISAFGAGAVEHAFFRYGPRD